MQSIDAELTTINTRAHQIANEVGAIDPQYAKIEQWIKDIKQATQSINNKIKTK